MKKQCSYLLAVLLVVVATGATPKPPTATPSTVGWDSKCTEFHAGIYKACAGPGWYARPDRKAGEFDFYQMTVERKEGDGSWLKLYSTRVSLQKLSKEVLTKPELNKVEIDDPTSAIVFTAGDKTFRYCIKK